MKAITLARTALVASFVALPALAAPAAQPPMNDFRQAFYNCEGDLAFVMAYDATRPKTAIMTTSNNNKEYELKRDKAEGGVQFSGGAVKFWTDGADVRVEGTELALSGCKRKT